MRIIEVGNPPQHIQLSEIAHCIFDKRNMGYSFQKISEEIYARTGKSKSSTDIERAYLQIVSDIEAIRSKGSYQQKTFWFQRSLIPARIVQLISSRMVSLFDILAMLLGTSLIAFSTFVATTQSRSNGFSSLSVFGGIFCFLVSLLIHEIGHASACKRYGIEPSEIGFGMYFIWPALYCNVSGIWSLNKWQRIVVDLGGIYFQMLTACFYLLCYLMNHESSFLNAFWLIVGSCVFYLNPFLKFDGYWIVSDFLGIPNLDQQPRKVFKHFFSVAFKKSAQPLPWKSPKKYAVIFYSMFYPLFWAFLLFSLLLKIIVSVLFS
jgi:putative peptide zinc metalloprotease protein